MPYAWNGDGEWHIAAKLKFASESVRYFAHTCGDWISGQANSKGGSWHVAFHTEPTGYAKTALSDLQGAWQNLRGAVVEALPFPEAERLIFHIDEAMSWESVRDLDNMRATLLLIRNIAFQSQVPDDLLEWIETVREDLDEVFAAIARGQVP